MILPPEHCRNLHNIMRPPGPLTDGLQQFITNHVHNNTIMAEIGCFSGASTLMFAQACPAGYVFAIDTWSQETVEPHFNMEDMERCFDQTAGLFLNVKKMKGRSLECVKAFGDKSIDLVYIDANHEYSDVYNDIAAWHRKVRDGGLIGGHDFLPESFPGVPRAVKEVFSRFYVYPDSSWIAQKEDIRG